MRHLRVIASDEFEGRETGMRGQKLAAEYLRNAFMEMGIPPWKRWGSKGWRGVISCPLCWMSTDLVEFGYERVGGRTGSWMTFIISLSA